MNEPHSDLNEALDEVQAILREACSGAPPPRPAVVRYTICRSVLLESRMRSSVPGFVVQCVTLDRFREFIGLYDPRIDVRVALIDAAFSKARAVAGSPRVVDIFGPGDF